MYKAYCVKNHSEEPGVNLKHPLVGRIFWRLSSNWLRRNDSVSRSVEMFSNFVLFFFVEILNKIPNFLEYLWTEAAAPLELGGL